MEHKSKEAKEFQDQNVIFNGYLSYGNRTFTRKDLEGGYKQYYGNGTGKYLA